MERKVEISQIKNGFLVKIENGSISTDKNDIMGQAMGAFGKMLNKVSKDKGDIPDAKKSIEDGIYYCKSVLEVNALIQLSYED